MVLVTDDIMRMPLQNRVHIKNIDIEDLALGAIESSSVVGVSCVSPGS